MDIFKDIGRITKNIKEHDVEIKVDGYGVSVYLIYETECNQNVIIPIRFDTLEKFSYIDHLEYIEKFKPTDFGIDLAEVNVIQKIMAYLEKHKEEICTLCEQLNYYRKQEEV